MPLLLLPLDPDTVPRRLRMDYDVLGNDPLFPPEPDKSLPQKVFSAIWDAQSEVLNGGFSQYFLNSSAESASFVVEAFTTIGAHNTASVCSRAINIALPDGLPLMVEEIQSMAEHFSKEILAKLDSLDQEFFSYPDDVTGLLFTYVSAHPEEFGNLPKTT